ncbi:MAG: AAA family ATPase [Planctomycetota bacterium]
MVKRNPKNSPPRRLQMMLADQSVPLALRRKLLGQVCAIQSEENDAALGSLLEAAARGNGKDLHLEKAKEYGELMQTIKEGALRPATFLRIVTPAGSGRRAEVAMPDGGSMYCSLPDAELAGELRRGDTVLLEAQGRAVLFKAESDHGVGEEGRLERRVGRERVEVSLRGQGRYVLHVSAELEEGLDRGEVNPGQSVVVCPQRMFAFAAVPREEGLSHYQFLLRETVPDVIPSRDIGDPPAYIEMLEDHVEISMRQPELLARYRIRPSRSLLLTGPTGVGKTLSLQALWRCIYGVMSRITGVAIEDLPPRVFRLRASELLSKWLGDSDKRIDRLFDEVEELAAKEFVAPGGERHLLPVLVIFEEIDGLARARGQDSIHDRILTTLLHRLDATNQKFKDQPVLMCFTTNVPEVVDPAFLRRVGGTVVRFERLNRHSFVTVLEKHLRGLPFAAPGLESRRRALADIVSWLFSPNGDQGQVEITFMGSTRPVKKYRRDMLTGALVDRAVQQAAAAACRAERDGVRPGGLRTRHLMVALAEQVNSIVERLNPHNLSTYVTLPDGMRVSAVRPIVQPSILPAEFMDEERSSAVAS